MTPSITLLIIMDETCFALSAVKPFAPHRRSPSAVGSLRARQTVCSKRVRSRVVPTCVGRRGVDPDDLPEKVGDGDVPPTELTLSQELLMKSYIEQIEHMSKEECDDLSVEIIRQSMVKDNLLRMLGLKAPASWLTPPNPTDFSENNIDGNDDKGPSESKK